MATGKAKSEIVALWVRASVERLTNVYRSSIRAFAAGLIKNYRASFGDCLYRTFLVLSSVAAFGLNLWVPPTGYAIAFLAVAAFIATFRDNIPSLQKILWATAVLGLFVAELRAINADRIQEEINRNVTLRTQQANFQKDITALDQALEELHRIERGNDLLEASEREILASTQEKGNYPYLGIQPLASSGPFTGSEWPLVITNSGREPLYEVTVMVLHLGSENHSFRVDVLPGQQQGPQTIKDYKLRVGFYIFEIDTRYNHFQETLDIYPAKKQPGYMQRILVRRTYDFNWVYQCCPPRDCRKTTCVQDPPTVWP